jgi:hypothetical protein
MARRTWPATRACGDTGRQSSPLAIDVTAGGDVSIVAAWLVALRYAVLHPQEVGAWVRQVREGWHLGRAKADRARVLAERLHEIGGDVTVQEPFGSPPGQSGPPGHP